MNPSSRGTADPTPSGAGSRWRQLASQWPVLLVLAVVAVGLAAALDHHWRKGVYVVGLGVLLAAVARAALPEARIGLLAVRSRRVDVLQTGFVAIALLLLGLLIPPVAPPG